MNNDFRRIMGTPGFNTSPVGADTQIQFALARVDPAGNPTNGINRVNLCQASWSTAEINSSVKPTTIWDATQYMNMWSVNFSDNSLLGYAQFPSGSGLAGLNASGGSAFTDGVVANYSTFGSIALNDGSFLLNAPYNLGRTMTHEVGHFLGLRHIWGDANCGTDHCADTPTANTFNYGCPTVIDCNHTGHEMVKNYTDDACMNIYTINQKDRITTVMNVSPRRASLKTSVKDIAIPLFANDAELKLEGVCTASGSQTCSTGGGPTLKVTIYNRGTANLTSAVIAYNIDGGTTYTYNWSGSLATHRFATFNMPVTNATNGVLNAAITTANGIVDQRATNNSVSTYYEIPGAPPSFNFVNVVYRLQKDTYGSETTWTLQNAAGTTLYSGGPYTDTSALPPLLTFNWTLTNNTCYKFTINDSFGDGICCNYGAGYYDIKSTTGTVVISGATFTNSENKSFNIQLLGNDEFAGLNDVYVYPNPAKESITISSSSTMALPKNFTVYNALGQLIATKNIGTENDLTFNTSNLGTGVYFITVERDNDKKTLRFIKE